MKEFLSLRTATDAVVEGLSRGDSIGVVGVPGSGKSTVVKDSFARLAESMNADSVLVLTPNREHADGLRDELKSPVRSSATARSVHSYAFGIVAAHTATTTGVPALFISGADQDVRLTEQLQGYFDGTVAEPTWTTSMTTELAHTDVFRTQLRDSISEIMGHDFSYDHIIELARTHNRPEWEVLSFIGREYEELLTFWGDGAVDTSAVFTKAKHIVEESSVVPGSTWDFAPEILPAWILCDSVQDFPDSALGFLRALYQRGVCFALTCSPDSATQSFRGASGDVFAGRHQLGVHTDIVLDPRDSNIRGAGAITRTVDSLMRSSADPVHALGYMAPQGSADGSSQVFTCECSSGSNAARKIAAMIYDRHQDGVPFADIAVVTRRASSAAQLSEELAASGIPVRTPARALGSDPATLPLLQVLSLSPDSADWPQVATACVTGAYGGLDALTLRSLQRELAQLSGLEGPLETLMEWALETTQELPAPVERAKRMVEAAKKSADELAQYAVWEVWNAAGVAHEWQEKALHNPSGHHSAYLDSVIRLLALADKLNEGATGQVKGRDFAMKVMSQKFAQDSLAHTALNDIVTVTTPAGVAHTSFDTVIVTDVQEGVWPNPNVRGTIFKTPQLIRALKDPASQEELSADNFSQHDFLVRRRETIRDEGKLFIAALSRARTQAVVVAINGHGELPSPLFTAIQGMEWTSQYWAEKPDVLPSTLSEIAGYARLQVNQALEEGDEDAARPWAQLLQALHGCGVGAADPNTWWLSPSSELPALPAHEPVRISPSQVETYAQCPLKWFFNQNSSQTIDTYPQAFGNLIHEIAQTYPHGGLADMLNLFDEKFQEFSFDSEWERQREYADGCATVENLNEYLKKREDKGFVAAEVVVRSDLDVPLGSARVSGRIDRLEKTPDGAAYIVDFKTGKTVPSKNSVQENPQLATYQVAIESGSATFIDDGKPIRGITQSAGGELVYPRKSAGKGKTPSNVREQKSIRGTDVYDTTVETIENLVRSARTHTFAATPSDEACRTCAFTQSCPAFALGESEES